MVARVCVWIRHKWKGVVMEPQMRHVLWKIQLSKACFGESAAHFDGGAHKSII